MMTCPVVAVCWAREVSLPSCATSSAATRSVTCNSSCAVRANPAMVSKDSPVRRAVAESRRAARSCSSVASNAPRSPWITARRDAYARIWRPSADVRVFVERSLRRVASPNPNAWARVCFCASAMAPEVRASSRSSWIRCVSVADPDCRARWRATSVARNRSNDCIRVDANPVPSVNWPIRREMASSPPAPRPASLIAAATPLNSRAAPPAFSSMRRRLVAAAASSRSSIRREMEAISRSSSPEAPAATDNRSCSRTSSRITPTALRLSIFTDSAN